jgi:hypothetical protein
MQELIIQYPLCTNLVGAGAESHRRDSAIRQRPPLFPFAPPHGGTVIATVGINIPENEAFFYFSEQFYAKGTAGAASACCKRR